MSQINTIELVKGLRKIISKPYVCPKLERVAQAIEEELRKRAQRAMAEVNAELA